MFTSFFPAAEGHVVAPPVHISPSEHHSPVAGLFKGVSGSYGEKGDWGRLGEGLRDVWQLICEDREAAVPWIEYK